MKKTLALLCLIAATFSNKSFAQCAAIDSLIYGFNDPSGIGSFTGYLCVGTDSVGTVGVFGYYDADSYVINLVAGSSVTFSVDSCNGNPVSLTVNDSTMNIIPGAYAAPGCPNALNFTPAYTGRYYITLNLNGSCGNPGASLLGEVYAKIQSGTTPPACPNANLVNDTICGAIPLTLGVFEHGNSSNASPTDPLDGYIVSIGDSCSLPNNTLWYSFTTPVGIDTAYIWLTSDPGSNFHSWLVGFQANSISNPCNGTLSFLGCINGPDDAAGIDTVVTVFYGVLPNVTYYLMIDGYNGQSGGFSLAVKTVPWVTAVSEESKYNLSLINDYANSLLVISSEIRKADLRLFDAMGKEVARYPSKDLRKMQISTSTLSPGLYFVSIEGPGFLLRRKIFVAR